MHLLAFLLPTLAAAAAVPEQSLHKRVITNTYKVSGGTAVCGPHVAPGAGLFYVTATVESINGLSETAAELWLQKDIGGSASAAGDQVNVASLTSSCLTLAAGDTLWSCSLTSTRGDNIKIKQEVIPCGKDTS